MTIVSVLKEMAEKMAEIEMRTTQHTMTRIHAPACVPMLTARDEAIRAAQTALDQALRMQVLVDNNIGG